MTEAPVARVVLASLPWGTFGEPALGLAVLKAVLGEAGIAGTVKHLNLGLLRHMTADTYSMLASFWGINEFLFTRALDGEVDEAQAGCLLERCALHAPEVRQARYRSPEALLELCLRARDEVMPRYLEECAAEVLALEPTLVGFTCMFDQTLASVALAKLLKARRPGLTVVLGGYALQGPPGDNVLRSFPWIDAIARGDGEAQIVRLAGASIGAEALAAIPGVCVQGQSVPVLPAPRIDLEGSPPPDYSDWFADLEALQARDRVGVQSQVLPVEASRGCWWGQHKHCVFCGIDEETLKYRAKSPARVMAGLTQTRARYGERIFRFSDYILPRQYYQDLLDTLAAVAPRFRLMGEMKANQTDERIGRFAAAGFVELQPGIESFSSEVLKLMDKGVGAIHNVLTLKAGYRHGIQINYNILYGLPGEKPEWYVAMLRQLPKLYHLTPPVSRTETIVTRFAPLQADPARFGLTARPRHHRCYDAMFSAAFLHSHDFSLDDHAYYFARSFAYPAELASLYRMLVEQVEHWKRQHRERAVYLHYRDDPDAAALEVRDARFGAERAYRLDGLPRRLCLACDGTALGLRALREQLDAPDEDALDAALARLCDDDRLLWRDGDHYLFLAVDEAVWRRHAARDWPRRWTANYC